jgi:uncharacterized caspase-like protein
VASKFALVIANTEYIDPGLAQLTAPGKDAKEFARVLDSPDICAFDDVVILFNETEAKVSESIDYFLSNRKPDDLLLLYFSGHGVRDEYGSLYLAVKNTNRSRLRSTAIKSDFIREAMDQSRSKRQVLILDCANSGAFAQGTKAANGESIGTAAAFEGAGYGRVVLTASDSTQFAWEGDRVIGDTENSLFTHFLVKGLEGEADLNGDGRITVDELFDYAYEQIVKITPNQTPSKFSYKQQGEIVLRQNILVEEVERALQEKTELEKRMGLDDSQPQQQTKSRKAQEESIAVGNIQVGGDVTGSVVIGSDSVISVRHQNPYIGPRTFLREEAHLFFGREREARELIALVESEQLVLFYAQSGAGKSSLVNTRLIPNLETKGYKVLPVGRVGGDLPSGIDVSDIYVYNLLRSLAQHNTDLRTFSSLSLYQFLAQLRSSSESDSSTVARQALIIDQFEELFSAHLEQWGRREDFFNQLAQAMQDDPQLQVVLVMRQDFLAALDPFAHLMSNGLRARYSMQLLEPDAALVAVTEPAKIMGRGYAPGVAEKLIDDLRSIKVYKPDGTLDTRPGQYVEPIQLQVVCYSLWENLPIDRIQITEEDLLQLGDVNQSLGRYYDGRVRAVAEAKNIAEGSIRAWFETRLITAGEIRNMVMREPETTGGLPNVVIQALEGDLVRAESRGGAIWYELAHDRLVEPILESNRPWFSENPSPLERETNEINLELNQDIEEGQQTGEPAELSPEQIAEREARRQAAEAANALINNRSQPVFNDKAQGEDQLGIKEEVEALAETLLLRDVEPPVAVGIMGGWGSGKSFVMYLIHQYIQSIRAKKIKKGWLDEGQTSDPKVPAFVGHVYQIHFNAWTYAKSNLWASLMDTIFSCLNRQMQLERLLAHRNFSAGNEPPSKNDIRDSMLDGGDEFKKIYLDNPQLGQDKDLEDCRKNLEHWSQHLLKGTLLWNVMRGQQVETLEKLKDTEEQLNQLKNRREQFEKDHVLDEKITSKDLKAPARRAYLQSLKSFMLAFLSDELSSAAKEELKQQDVQEEDVQKFLEEAKGLAGGVKTLITAFRRNKIYLFWTIAFFAVTLWLLYTWLAKGASTSIELWIKPVLSLIVAALPALRIAIPWVKKSMDASLEAKKILEGAYAAQQAKKAEEIANSTNKPLSKKVSELQAEISNGSLPAYDALIGLLEAQAEEQRQKIGPSAKYSNLMEFVQSRLDAATYETQLGLMHQVRQDIDELTYSLVDNASPEYFPRGKPRVILYIDDLDRCPPSRVVEALEAVQLLLNTKLFIVILGLDTRYVTRALEKEYKEILQHEGDPSGLDYIEKIIQIPYRVRSIEANGLRNYIEKQMDIEKVAEQMKSAEPPLAQQEAVQTDLPTQGQPSDEIKVSPQQILAEAIQVPSNGKEEAKEQTVEQLVEPGIQRPELPVETKAQESPLEEAKQVEPDLQVEPSVQRTEQPAETNVQEPPPSEVPKEGEPEPPVEAKTKEIEEFEFSAEVIRFKQEDLEDLTACCQRIALTPRSIKRLVNVFKLMKIFWFRADKNAGIAERDRPRPVKQAAICLLALASAYPEVMREVFVHLETLYRQGQEQTELFSALNSIKLPPGSASELSWQLQKYKADISALKAIAGNGQDKFGQLTLQNLKLSTFNIVRSFSFVGDPVYWTDDEDQVSISNGNKPQPAKAKRNKNGK